MSYSYDDSEMKRLPYLTTKPDVPSNAKELNPHTEFAGQLHPAFS